MKLTPSSTARRRTRMHSSWIGRRAPDALAGQAHGAESEAVDREVAADGEGGPIFSDALRVICPTYPHGKVAW